MKVIFKATPARAKPRTGDRKMLKGQLVERQPKKVFDQYGRPVGYDCTGGRQRHVWVPVPPTAGSGLGA